MGRLTRTALALLLVSSTALRAEPVRIATYDAELGRRGPGLLLADILNGETQVAAVIAVIVEARPDVLLLSGFDHDLEGHALSAFSAALAQAGLDFPHRFAAPPNSGVETGLDMDGNGVRGEARDAQGYGRFTGAGGMALLSRYPLGATRDFSTFLWSDLPGAILPVVDGAPFPSPEAQAAQRLSSVAHWDVEVRLPGGPVHLLAFNATTPVYDGPEDLNGRRNHDEIVFWQKLLDGALPFTAPAGPFVILGNANLDPADGEGRREAIAALIADPRLQDPAPTSPGGLEAANPGQAGDAALDTVDWTDPRPGNLRVDYLLPDTRLNVVDAGVIWPIAGDPFAETVAAASRHRLVWVDVTLP